ncbi:hypothetical protein FB566_4070 [Stackebrandtia endophytica]|uniref:Integral membrane protein n=1 Tax=Stackebrandtia endophytica TaxID=1496996 RepID=A0A543B0Y1_9ACTN|nr:hypothetical protein [Stackebrandtia endophytica]TQL78482.1 hypothetical protein FB566_4070 [Stackebrandtia endophytica]
MSRFQHWVRRQGSSLVLAGRALRGWGLRQWSTATLVALVVGGFIGLVTVLIPNPIFGREIPPVPWNYPVWIATAALTGILVATYVRPPGGETTREDRRSARFGGVGGILAWFAVGCPVCNKIALLALGYTGALTWFAPLQPFMAVAALGLSAVAVVWRLRGQVACPLPAPEKVAA